MTSAQSIPAMSPAPVEAFVDPDTAARYLHTTRRQLLEMVRAGRHTWCENSASMAPFIGRHCTHPVSEHTFYWPRFGHTCPVTR